MKVNETKKKGEKTDARFIRKSVTLPKEIGEFALDRAGAPEHAGNLSSYIRGLINRDREQQKAA